MRKSHVVTCVYLGAGCVGAMNVPLLGFSVEPQCLQRVIDDVCRDAGYEELTTNQVDAITTFLHGYKPYKWNFTAQKGKGDREKRTSDRARTRDLRSIAEFQPREPWRPAEILRPPSPYVPVTGAPLSSDA